jgi:hypothetical protein
MRFQVLTAVTLKIGALWATAPCSLGVDRRYRGAYCLHHQGDGRGITLMMKPLRTSETSDYSETTGRCIPEGCNLELRNYLSAKLINKLSS